MGNMIGEHREWKTLLWNRGVMTVGFNDGECRDKGTPLLNIGTGKSFWEYRHCKH